MPSSGRYGTHWFLTARHIPYLLDACDIRLTAYKDGRSFADCRDVAQSLMPSLELQIRKDGQMTWDSIMDMAEFDAVVYKLALKYLRDRGYDIGNHARQSVSV